MNIGWADDSVAGNAGKDVDAGGRLRGDGHDWPTHLNVGLSMIKAK